MKAPIFKFVLLAVFSVFLLAKTFAQPLQISVTVTPPYSIHLSDYINSGDNVLLTIINTSNTTHNYKLITSLTGDNGVSISLKTSYVPTSAITIQAFETQVLTFNQLQQYTGNLSSNDLNMSGVSQNQIVKTESLPEGVYTLCVKALEYTTSAPLSSDFGCSTFPLTNYDPPIVIYPADDSDVNPNTPQNIVFTWTPTGIPGLTNYYFELVDMTLNALNNPNDAFDNPAVQVYVVQDIVTSQLVYDLSFPPLLEDHKYAIRVTAYDPQGNMAFKNLGKSPVTTFNYKKQLIFKGNNNNNKLANNNNQGGVQLVVLGNKIWDLLDAPPKNNNPVLDPEDSPDCIGTCAIPQAYPANGNVNVKIGDDVIVGKFKMKVTSVSNNTGEGTIFINWLKTLVVVKFKNIKVNTDMQLYSGEVFAKIDAAGIPEQIAKNQNADLSQLQNNIDDIQNSILQANRRISNFLPNNQNPIGLPLALDNNKYDLAIVGIIFKPTTAYVNLMLPVQIPEAINGDFLSIHASGICIRPNGMGAAGKIILEQDVTVELSNYVKLKFVKTNTFVEFDCSGVTKAHIKGQLDFERDLLLPINNNGEVANGKVKAQFDVDIDDQHNWMAEDVTLTPAKFTTPATKGFIFSAQNLKYDHSDLSNPQNIAFPNNYPNKTNTWKGLYIQNISCQLPDGFQQGDDPLKIEVQNMFIDKYGFTGGVMAQNLIDFEQGKLDGWKFSLDNFELQLLNSGLESGNFAGDIRIPISETGLGYDVTISAPQNNNSGVDFEFIIEDLPDLDVKMWFAEMSLENTTIDLTKEGDKFKIGATLNGDINIGWKSGDNNTSNSVSNFSIPPVEFTGLEIGGGNTPTIDNGSFGINPNLQGKCASFPIVLEEINFDFNGPSVGINFQNLGFKLTSQANSLGGDASFTVFAQWNPQEGIFKYNNTFLEAIHVDVDLGALAVEGDITIYKEDEVYGNGFRGAIEAKVKMTNTAIALTLQAGKTLGQNGFRYFYFDGLVDLGDNLGIPIGATGVALYGFGGGMRYNMERIANYDKSNPLMADQYSGDGYDDNTGTTESGVVFKPKKGILGFKASILFGIYQARDVFNGDLEFGMELNVQTIALKSMYMEGNGYVMQSPTGDRSPESATIAGSVLINIDFENPTFHCLAGVSVNIGDVLKGGGTIEMHYEKLNENEKKWYLKVGQWNEDSQYAQDYPWKDDQRFSVQVDLKIVKAYFHGYFMVGNDIQGLPPLPKVIRDNLGEMDDNRNPSLGTNPISGLGMGVGIHVDANFKFLIFYADVTLSLGADVLIADYGSVDCGGFNPIGVNGWYAKGQAYGHFFGDAGLYVDVWFFEGKKSLMELEATAYLYAQGPRPMYVKGRIAIHGEVFDGLIKVNTSFTMEAGEKCALPEYNPFDDIPIVSHVLPGDGDKEVDTGSEIQVAFNFPNHDFTIEEETEEGGIKIRTFNYDINKWELKKGNTVLKWQTHKYAADGYSRKSILDAYMPGYSNIKYYMLVKGYELTKGKKEMASQTYEGTFKSGPLPTTLRPEDVKAMQPLGGKRFVLPEEYDKGYIRMKYAGLDYLFNPGAPATGQNQYVARFTVLETGQVSVETPVTYNDTKKKVGFAMPDNLVGQKIYGIQIVRIHSIPINQIKSNTNTKDTYKDHYLTGGPGGGGIKGNGIGKIKMQQNNNANNNQNKGQINILQNNNKGGGQQQMQLNLNLVNNYNNKNQGKGKILPLANNNPPKPPGNGWAINNGFANNNKGEGVKIEILNRELLKQTKSQKEEFLLYTYYWKTSKYKNWNDKLASAKLKASTEAHPKNTDWKETNTSTNTQFNVVYLQLDENIDHYDAYGFKYNIGNLKYNIKPKMEFKLPYGNNAMSTTFGEGEIYPWDAPDEYDWGNGVELFDGLEMKFFKNMPDFEAYWPDKFNDWTEDRFDGKLKGMQAFGNRNIPVPMNYKGWEENPPIEIYKLKTHGVINFKNPTNLPAGNLTKSEVQAAIAKAPNPKKQGPAINMLFNGQGMQGGGMQNMNMGFQNNSLFNIPLLEYQDWVIAHDYTWMKDFVITAITEKLNSYPQNGGDYWDFHGKVYEPILYWMNSDYISEPVRAKMTNTVIINGKEFEYQTTNLY